MAQETKSNILKKRNRLKGCNSSMIQLYMIG